MTTTPSTESVVSIDGTTIAYDRITGREAGTVIVVGGAFDSRTSPKMVELGRALAEQHGFTVINYDRRGRGDSGDTSGTYNVEREIDDIDALVAAADGSAYLFGWSSGAVLALLAAASGRIPGIGRVVAFEPPVVVEAGHHVPPADPHTKLSELVSAGKTDRAVWYFMNQVMGVPRMFLALTRFTSGWKRSAATANSTPHEWAVLGPYMRGKALREDDWAGLTVPTLVIAGGRSAPALRAAASAFAAVLPDGRLHEPAKLGSDQAIAFLAPAAAEFFAEVSTEQ